MAGQSIRGVQDQRVVSTVKHFVLNAQETLRHSLDVRMDEAALRQSDLLAFQIAIEQGGPGAVMCAYNRVNGAYGCSNDWLLNRVLRRHWGYKGWVMSDWGATHGPTDMAAGLDQQSGAQLDRQIWFGAPLRAAIAAGDVPRAALTTSVRRILRSVFAVGADAPTVAAPVNRTAHAAIARRVAEEGIVLLKNDGVLPLADRPMHVLVVGRFADRGVWSGGGSSQVIPYGGPAARVPYGGNPFLNVNGAQVIVPSSPLAHLARLLPSATIEFDTGYVPELATARARNVDLVIAFANKWQVESLDTASLALPEGQDTLVDALATANPNTVVVLETGNPVAMPWLGKVRGVVEAWFSGQEGGAAIADVLTGKVNPSGRLPMTFPRSVDQAPRASVPGLGLPDDGRSFPVSYVEGADVGYRWYANKNRMPLFAFGHGLSYTTFAHGPLAIVKGRRLTASVAVTNTGSVSGADVAQVYLVGRAGRAMRRLVGFARVPLAPGERRQVGIAVDHRLLADWDGGEWRMPAGDYAFALGRSAMDLSAPTTVRLPLRRWMN